MTVARRAAAIVALVLWAVANASPALRSVPAKAQDIVDDPWQLRRAQGWRDQIGGGVHGMAVDGDRLYAVVGGRLHVYDVADPARPQRLGRSVPWLGGLLSEEGWSLVGENIVEARGHGVYVAQGQTQGVIGIDVADPTSPRLVALGPYGPNPHQLSIVGEQLVTLDYGRGIGGFGIVALIGWWSISEPAALARTRLTMVPDLDLPLVAVRTSDRQALTTNHAGGSKLLWVDLASLETTIQPSATLNLGPHMTIVSMALLDSVAVALSVNELEPPNPMSLVVVDAHEPASLAVRSTLPLSVTAFSESPPGLVPAVVASELVAAGTHAFVPIAPEGHPQIASIDIADPDLPRLEGTAPLHGSANELRLAGERLYVGNSIDIATTHAAPPPDYHGVEIFDIADPSNPRPIGVVDDMWNAVDVAAIGSYAFVAAASSGLRVVDVSDRDAAIEIAALSEIGDVTAVKVLSGNHIIATVASGSHQGVVTIDVADPASPTIAGRVALREHSEVVDLAVDGTKAVVVAHDGFVHVLDVANVAAPGLVATIDAAPLPDTPLSLSDPAPPDVFARAIDVEDGMAFVGVTADDWQQAWIVSIDVADASAPRQRAAVQVPPKSSGMPPLMEVRDVAIDGGRVAVSTSDRARIYMADREGTLSSAGSYGTFGLGTLAVAWRGQAVVAATHGGHVVVDARDLAHPRSDVSRARFVPSSRPSRRHGGLAFLADGTILQAHGSQGLLIADPVVLSVTPTATAVPSPTATESPTAAATATPTSEPPTSEPPTRPPGPEPSPSATTSPTEVASPGPTTSPATPSPTATATPTHTAPSATPPPTRRATGPSTVYLPLALAGR